MKTGQLNTKHHVVSQRIDRRRFLVGAAGVTLALPMLEAHTPRLAMGQDAAPPKRLVIVMHPHGRIVGTGRAPRSGGGQMQDNWSPSGTSGPLPATGDISPALAALGPIRNEITTVDRVDNLIRHMTGDGDGHMSAARTCLTCSIPRQDTTSSEPSFDYVMGQRLRSSPAQRSALIFPGSANGYYGAIFYGAGGTEPAVLPANPRNALVDLFGNATAEPEPTVKTLRDRLVESRGSILDSVAQSYLSLGNQLNAADRARLEQHADFIRALETQLAGADVDFSAQGCNRPDESQMPQYNNRDTNRGAIDDQVIPWTIENLVMSLACDITRVASLHFPLDYNPTFPSEFSGTSPLAGDADYHSMVHDTPSLSSPNQGALTQAFQFYGKMFARLVQRLAETTDTDGSRLLDNTLVLWVSDMGYGAPHHDFNIPVVMAGLQSEFAQPHGRHVVLPERRSLGDLYAQAMRMFGGSDTTFGQTGNLGATGLSNNEALNAWAGFEWDYVSPSLPTHLGELDI